MNNDAEHLRLLAIFHYVAAGMTALFSICLASRYTSGPKGGQAILWLLASPEPACATEPDARLPDGAAYYGAIVDGRLTGRGRLEWTNGARYEREFRDGLFHGQGRPVGAEGSVYVGTFVAGLFEGKGHLEYVDGTRARTARSTRGASSSR